jgi:hypothetical protein
MNPRRRDGMKGYAGLVALLAIASNPAWAQGLESAPSVRAETPALAVARTTWRGRRALNVRDVPEVAGSCCLIPLDAPGFHNGTIEAWVAGQPLAGASAGARGFIGLAFRVQDDGRYEAFYIRPTNGRADDQLRRNHATQYISEPDFPWERLRRETPGVYESYVDLEPGIWTHLRIEVSGGRARLYVNRSPQPVLIVNDLKLGAEASGGVALWIGDETDGYFADVTVAAE